MATQAQTPTVIARGSLTIAEIHDGADGEAAVMYRVVADTNAVTRKLDGTLSPDSVKCYVYKITGDSSRQLTAEKTLRVHRVLVDGTAAETTVPRDGGVSAPVILIADDARLEFRLYDSATVFDSTTLLDTETVTVMTDADELKEELDKYKYLKEALADRTTIDGGLLLTSLIRLGRDNSDATSQTVWSGLNGVYTKGRDISFWAGGDAVDLFLDNDLRKTAEQLTGLRPASSLIRMDGSAYWANGNVGFKANGEAWFGGQNGLQIDEFGNITIGSGVKINLSDGEKGIIESLQSLTNFHIGLTRLLAPCNANNEEISWQEAFQHDGTSDPDAIMAKSLKAKVGLWSTGFLSAMGLNDSAGSGSAYDRLDSWNAYTEDKAGYVLSAALGHDLYTGKADVSALGALTSRVSVLESKNYLSDLVLSQSGSGNAVTNVALSADKKTLTVTKGATYALSSALSNYVTLDTEQTISKRKKFLTDIEFPRSTVEMQGGKAIGITWNDRDQGSTAQKLQVGSMTGEDADGNITQRYLYLGWGLYPYSLGQNFAVCKDFIKYKNLDVLHAGNYAAVLGNVYQAKGDYVTRNTIQDITARKQFNSVVIFNRPIAEYQPAFLINKAGKYFGMGGTETYNEIQLGLANSSHTWDDDDSLKIRVRGSATASQFIKSGGTSSQFLKADGSVDSNSYALSSALSNYYTKTETNNGFLHTADHMKYAGSLYDKSDAAAYKITTTWTKADGNGMPTINIRGYAYVASSAIDIDIVSYQYSNQYWNIGAVSKGSWRPENIYLTAENGKTVIYLVPDNTLYMGQLHVFVYRGFNITRQQMEGWTIEALSAKPTITSDMQLVPWRAISGSIDNSANLGGIAASEYITKSNYPSVLDSRYLQSSTAASTYVKKSGDTMTGPLIIESGNDHKIILNNTDTETKYQQIAFQQNGVQYGTLGTHHDDYLRWNGYKIWDQGNDGPGSGLDADLLDGAHADDIRKSVLAFKTFTGTSAPGSYDLNTLAPDGGLIFNYNSADVWVNAPAGASYGIALHLKGWGNLAGQLFADIKHNSATDVTRNLWWRASGSVNGQKAWGKWHQIAFTDSNVDSATKLADNTAVKAWGKTFFANGKPQSVSGDMTGVGNIFLNTARFIYAPDSEGTNRTLIDFYGGQKPTFAYGFATAGTDVEYCGNNIYFAYGTGHTKGVILNSAGNLGIGTTAPEYRLDVNGTARFSEVKIGEATITYDKASEGLKIDKGLYSTGYLSAIGIDPDSGNAGGSAYGLMRSWPAADPGDTTEDALGANLGFYLYKNKADLTALTALTSRVTTLEGKNSLSDLILSQSGSGNAVTAISLSADKKTITATRGATFLTTTAAASTYQPKGNYLTAITKSQVEAVLTGNITSHTHSQYLTTSASIPWGKITGRPTTLGSYGITDAISFYTSADYVAARFKDDAIMQKAAESYIEWWGSAGWHNFVLGKLTANGTVTAQSFVTAGSVSAAQLSLNGGSNPIEWDAENNAYKVNGNLYATGFLSALGFSYISATEVAVTSITVNDAKFTVEGSEVYVTIGPTKYKLTKTTV